MEIRVLKYFLAIAREENITAAAASLHISQPALSKQIQELEKELGKTLFVRGNRKVTLTEDGMLLRKRAREIIALVTKTEAELSSESNVNTEGDIYIGAAETQVMRIITKTIIEIHSTYPNIHFHLYSGNSDDVLERLDKGLLDFGVLIDSTSYDKYDSLVLPQKDVWGLITSKNNPLAKKSFVTPKDLQNIPLIISEQAHSQATLSSWMHEDICSLQVVSSYNLLFNATLEAQEGLGSIVSLNNIADTSTGSSLQFIPFKPKLESNVILVWKKYQVFSSCMQIFMRELKKQINNGVTINIEEKS